MRTEGKKYIIRESELKEIIQEMLLTELYDPSVHKAMHTKYYTGQSPNAGDVLNSAGNLLKNLPRAIGDSLPDDWKARIQNGDTNFAQWLKGFLGLNAAGEAGPDFNIFGFNPSTAFGRGGKNNDAREVFNVAAACQWLMLYSKPKPIKPAECAKYVRIAMNKGGLSAPWNMWARYAKNYIQILPANGWVQISESQAGQPGDVMVIDACKTTKPRTSHPFGHIAMCVGNGQWISDFKQTSVYGLKGTPPPSVIHFFRYRNIQNGNTPPMSANGNGGNGYSGRGTGGGAR